jgi:DeoR family transcriptional regulator of aga operon
MLAAATRSVLLVDAEKFSMAGTIRVCSISDLDVVVTDAGPDETAVAAIAALGVEVVRG